MINIVENYRMALAKRKKARAAEAKAHKHAKRVAAYHDGIRKMLAEDQAWREQREREAERNEFAGLTRITLRSNDHD